MPDPIAPISPPHVFTGVSAVTKALASEGIDKTRQNRDQGFKFRGIDDILNELSPLLVEHRLVVLPKFFDREVTLRTSAKGSAIFNVTMKGLFRIQSLADGSSLECGPFVGEAMDFADKATNKAMSACYKYFAILTFCIPLTGADFADADAGPAPRVATEKELEAIAVAQKVEDEKEESARRLRTITLAATLDELHVNYVKAYKAATPAERLSLAKAKDIRKKELTPAGNAVEDVPPEDPKATPPSRRGRKPESKEPQE